MLACLTLLNSPNSHGESFLVYGKAGALRERLETAVRIALPEHAVYASDASQERMDLAIIVGAAALEKFCSEDRSTPAIVTHIYERRLDGASQHCQQAVGAVFFDAPFQAQANLAEAIFPSQKSAALIPPSSINGQPTAKGVDLPFALENDTVYPALKAMLATEPDWSVFFVTMDPRIYRGSDYRLTIETLARNRKAAIVPVMSLVKAGAVAGVYYDDTSLERALLRAIQTFLSEGESIKIRSTHLSVAINHSILRTLFGRTLSVAEIEAIEGRLNE